MVYPQSDAGHPIDGKDEMAEDELSVILTPPYHSHKDSYPHDIPIHELPMGGFPTGVLLPVYPSLLSKIAHAFHTSS